MNESLARVKILIFDSCHSGAIKGAKDSGIMTDDMYQSFFPPPEGFVVLSSCKQSEFSYEWPEKEHGVFSYFLLEGLRGKADRNEDGIITISDAYFYTTEKVKEWAFSKGIKQSPIYEARITGDIPFVISKERKGEEAIIDRTIINKIRLVSEYFYDGDEMDSAIQKTCGGFLEYFKSVDIKRKSNLRIEFPYGEIGLFSDRSPGGTYRSFYEILMYYVKENWSKIDKLISGLDKAFNWRQLSYELIAPINFGNLVSKCRETGFKILGFDPSENSEQLIVERSGWASTITTFQNSEGTSSVTFNPRKQDRGRFPELVYDTINPNNLITFLTEILKDVS